MSDTSEASLSGVGLVTRTHLRVVGALVLADLVGLTIVVISRPRSGLAMTVGDLSELGAALLAFAGCAVAARRGGPDRRAWAVMASAMGVWTLAVTLWTWYGLTLDHVYPFPSVADAGFVGYAVPVVAALLLFPRSSLRRASRLRVLLDAAVIAGSVSFVSWATVLGPLFQSGGTGLTRFVGLAYPVADIAVASVVLVLGMRAAPEYRRQWLLLGVGLVLLTVTDSTFVSMTLQGQTGATGTPLVLGWVGAMALIAASSQVRPRRVGPVKFRHFTVLQELLPTLPVVGAIAVAFTGRLDAGDVFLVGNAIVLMVLFATQQVVAVIERVRLANGLEETILRRTAELSSADARFRAMVESSDDAIISTTPDRVITSWNAAAERLLGYSSQEVLGQPLDLIIPEDRRAESVEIRRRTLTVGSIRQGFETERVRKDGTHVPVATTVSPIYDGDTITGVSAILRDITDRLTLQREMEFRAMHDTLTGLPNRELLAQRLGQALRVESGAGTTGLLVIDLDRFKEVNDTFGYHCGDELLRQVGPRLVGVLRDIDTVARLVGDEFAVLLPDMGDAGETTAAALKVMAALETPFLVAGADLDVEASIGVVISGEHGSDATTLLQCADIALDIAKRQTIGVFVYDPAFDSRAPSRLALLGDLRRALERDELMLHFQPKVNVRTGAVVGAEALVRWQHPERGLVFPDDFIPVAEHTALIGPLTRQVLDTALAQVRTWIDADQPLPIAVNLSARNLLDEHLADQVAELLGDHGVPGALLGLEVTESAIMIDPVRARQTLEQLSALGVRISIDDFGAGYTSLSQLTTLPVDELKIDRSFVTSMVSDPGNAMIVQSVIDLGHNLNLTLVAEGVETEEALTALASLDCDVAQGYHICRPLPPAAFDEWRAERTSTAPEPGRTPPNAPTVAARTAGRTLEEGLPGHSLKAPDDESMDNDDGERVGGDTAVVARLLERAQCGEHDEALRLAEKALRAPTGDLGDGAAGMHFVRFVALVVQGRSSEAMGAIDLMLQSAEREGNQGWRSCALSGRAYQRLMIGDQLADHDVHAVLQDLVDAETALASGVEDSVIAENAHTGVALGYHQLRLYELALPQYEAAYAVSPQDGRQTGNRAMWQCNIATLHLEWALELYRVGQVAEAELHSLAAGAHAALAVEQARGPDAERWRQDALLLAACATADGPDPAGAARSIERYAAVLGERGQRIEVAFCWPFLAVALNRTGEHERALQAIDRAAAELPADAGWLTAAAVNHTRAILLAREGGLAATAALAYGDTLAQALWRQRQGTLQTATIMKSYDLLRHEHERVARTADTDSLTEVANRRAFDRVVESMGVSGGDRRVAVLLVDLDKLKEVNDSHGHAAGDAALRAVAVVLAGEVRGGDLVARLGGDEFGVLLPGADADTAIRVAQRMVEAIDALDDCAVTVSIGVSSGAASGVSATWHAADSAMYVAKRAGGNRAHLHEPLS